jgi:putative tryptophan/tyrosine transport system substrate-binding protein
MKIFVLLVVLMAVQTLFENVSKADQSRQVPRIGIVVSGSASNPEQYRNRAVFLNALTELGYIAGQNIILDYRYAEGKAEALPELLRELIRLKVSILIPSGPTALEPAVKATQTIPILMHESGNAVRRGFIETMSRPGRNVTGVSTYLPGLYAKHLELLKETGKFAVRIAVIIPTRNSSIDEYRAAAQSLQMEIQSHDYFDSDGLKAVLLRLASARPDALAVVRHTSTIQHASQITEFALKKRLPSMFDSQQFVQAGGLMSYGINRGSVWRRIAVYVDKLLKGVNPATLPVVPAQLEFAINLKTARTIGVAIPPEILLEANSVIR